VASGSLGGMCSSSRAASGSAQSTTSKSGDPVHEQRVRCLGVTFESISSVTIYSPSELPSMRCAAMRVGSSGRTEVAGSRFARASRVVALWLVFGLPRIGVRCASSHPMTTC
jgi:hypothetical protein